MMAARKKGDRCRPKQKTLDDGCHPGFSRSRKQARKTTRPSETARKALHEEVFWFAHGMALRTRQGLKMDCREIIQICGSAVKWRSLANYLAQMVTADSN